jgi:hypothetical protein
MQWQIEDGAELVPAFHAPLFQQALIDPVTISEGIYSIHVF